MSKITGAISKIFHSDLVEGLREEFLPEEKALRLKLDKLCRQCPAGCRDNEHQVSETVIRGSTEFCRKEYFSLLLQSFMGKSGSEETDRLYTLWRACEECLCSHGPACNTTGASGEEPDRK